MTEAFYDSQIGESQEVLMGPVRGPEAAGCAPGGWELRRSGAINERLGGREDVPGRLHV